ncbi:YcjF family protein [Intestinimonas butyriciproducens]|uniref:YcjF family protein n=1 Tax=Intestinimonas butyriciproducens TaxID=1297617 RepID=UPI00242A7CA5|nr:GTPase [Intestinimonas butyriciproducens]MCI6363329.1 50S ribosome-binding GTPase [Intestinimonas butyriciproducens]MDY3614850.1 GTPase [Intestinimonas butyriciproducens]
MAIDTDKIAQEAIDAIAEKIKNLNTLNIIVAGKTGVGKSTLINAVFRDKLAETGMGKPVTDHMRKISKKGIPLAIYDTKGFELGRDVQQQVKQEVMETISKGLATQDINKAIHCIWYCINTASNRVEPEEIEWLKELSKENQITQVPIIVVLTQSFSKKNADAMRKMILNENLDVVQVVPVLAEDYEIDEAFVARSYGLDVLIHVMGEALPDELMDTLQNVQIASLAEKKKRAQAAIATATLAAAGEGAAPIPFSDCALLIPTQLGMIASITVIFGFDVNKSILTAFLSSTLGSGGATLLGKTVVSNLVKLIPGVGTIAGGAISAATAGVLTAALGEAYIGIMTLVFNGEMSIDDLGTKRGKDQMTALFKYELKKQR